MNDSLDRNNAAANAKKKADFSELPARIGSAVILGALSIYATWVGGLTFSLLILAACFFVFWEFKNIVSKSMPFIVGVFSLCFLFLFCASWFVKEIDTGFMLLGISFLALIAWEYFSKKSVWGAAALIYAALPFISLVLLRDDPNGLLIILFLFACVWGADTFAYFTGKLVGGPKLWPAVSPKKTWSGFIGGLIGACALTSLVLWFFGYSFSFTSFMLTLVLGIAAQAGDLFESSIKRKFDVKDSGKIIPGHGGVLDRIDGLIFAGVLAFLIGFYFNGITLSGEGVSTALLNLMR